MKRTTILSLFLMLMLSAGYLPAQNSYMENPRMISENKLEPRCQTLAQTA